MQDGSPTPPPLPGDPATARMPGVVKTAATLQIIGLLLSIYGVAALLLDQDRIDALLEAQGDMPESFRIGATIGVAMGSLISIGIAGLALFGTLRGIHVIRLIWTVLTGLGLLVVPASHLATKLVPDDAGGPPLPEAADPLGLLQLALSVVAVVLVWLPPARPWFDPKRARGPEL